MTASAVTPDGFEPLPGYREYPPAEMEARAAAFAAELGRRRTTRHFSDRPVSRAVIEHCLRAAASAPSGAHQQPWHFVVVGDPGLKRRIREAAEAAEAEFYAAAPADWLAALAPLGTDAVKPYLETAPYLIAVFAQRYGMAADGSRRTHYYVNESVGIATGFLLAALHHAGLATLTHTPNPMGFLSEALGRPANEKPVMLVVTGYPAPDARVPRLTRKRLHEIATFHDRNNDPPAAAETDAERSDEMSIVPLIAAHWQAVREIYVQGIETGDATFETEAPDWSSWDATHESACRLVAMRAGGVVGWAALSPVSRRPAYRGVAEVSVYVHRDARGTGVGRRLLAALVTGSETAGYWTLQASVFPGNEATLRLHTAAGFRSVGYRDRIGRLRDEWRDTILLERRSAIVGV